MSNKLITSLYIILILIGKNKLFFKHDIKKDKSILSLIKRFYFVEVLVPSQESEWSCICVLGVSVMYMCVRGISHVYVC
jgi:hypothetical protein